MAEAPPPCRRGPEGGLAPAKLRAQAQIESTGGGHRDQAGTPAGNTAAKAERQHLLGAQIDKGNLEPERDAVEPGKELGQSLDRARIGIGKDELEMLNAGHATG